MNNIVEKYPFTNFHEMNLDFIMELCEKSLGLKLVWSDANTLQLCTHDGTTVSDIEIKQATKALKDKDGNAIMAYYVHSVTAEADAIVITYGDGSKQVVTVPFATKALNDTNGKDLKTYVARICFEGDKLVVYDGNGATVLSTLVPYAVRALNDENGNDIRKQYVHRFSSTAGEDEVVVYDGNDAETFRVTVDFATRALNDYTGNKIRQHYVHDSNSDVATEGGKIHFTNAEGDVIAEYIVGYATMAKLDVTGKEFRDEYAHDLQPDDTTITLYNDKGVGLATITVPYATKAEYIQDGVTRIDSAVADVVVDGKELKVSYLNKSDKKITVSYATQASKDDLENLITATYVSKVYNNTETGELVFYAANGDVIAQLRPVVTSAVYDNTGKKITSYVQSVTVAEDSNYVTITHGDGTTELLEVPYSTKALQDTYGNVIGNDYAFSFDTIVDETIKPEVGSNVIKVVNGEGQEIRRVVINNVQYAKTCGKVIDMKIDDLTDVDTTGVADGNTLVYEASSKTWKPGEASGGTGEQRTVEIRQTDLTLLDENIQYCPYNSNSYLDSATINHYYYRKTYDRLAGYGETRIRTYLDYTDTNTGDQIIGDVIGYLDFGLGVPRMTDDVTKWKFSKYTYRSATNTKQGDPIHDEAAEEWTIPNVLSFAGTATIQIPDKYSTITYDSYDLPNYPFVIPKSCGAIALVYDADANKLVFGQYNDSFSYKTNSSDVVLGYYGGTPFLGALTDTLPTNYTVILSMVVDGPWCTDYWLENDLKVITFPTPTPTETIETGSTDADIVLNKLGATGIESFMADGQFDYNGHTVSLVGTNPMFTPNIEGYFNFEIAPIYAYNWTEYSTGEEVSHVGLAKSTNYVPLRYKLKSSAEDENSFTATFVYNKDSTKSDEPDADIATVKATDDETITTKVNVADIAYKAKATTIELTGTKTVLSELYTKYQYAFKVYCSAVSTDTPAYTADGSFTIKTT